MRGRGRTGCAVGLIYFQAVDEPVHVFERARVVLHIALAGICKCSAFRRIGPHGTRPIAAEGGIEDLISVSIFKVMENEAGGMKGQERTICWFLKWLSISQPPSNCATGAPHVAGFGAPLEMSAGVVPLGKNQMLIASLVHSVAITPPPLALKPAP